MLVQQVEVALEITIKMNKITERRNNAFPNVNSLDHKSTLTFAQEEFKDMSEDEKRQYLKQQAIDKQVANVTVEGSTQGGTGVGYESAWNNMANEEKAKYGGDYGKFVEAAQEYHKTQNTKTYELTKNVTTSARPWKLTTASGKTKDFGITIGERNRKIQEFKDNDDQEGYKRWLFETTGKTSEQWKAFRERMAAKGSVRGSSVGYSFSSV